MHPRSAHTHTEEKTYYDAAVAVGVAVDVILLLLPLLLLFLLLLLHTTDFLPLRLARRFYLYASACIFVCYFYALLRFAILLSPLSLRACKV